MDKPISIERKKDATLEGIKNGHIPRYLYKYMDYESVKKVIENNSIRFNSSSNFNDPFDGKALVRYEIPPDEIASFYGLNLLPEPQRSMAISRIAMDPNKLGAIQESIFRYFDEHTAISCFSEVGDNLLMWSHYSDKHGGVCLKFDVMQDLAFFSLLARVNYKKTFLSYPFAEVKKYIYEQYSTKGEQWAYEREIRIIKSDTTPDCFRFEKKALVEVSFGCKSREENITEIKELLRKQGYENVELRLAVIGREEYKLNFESL